MYADTMPGEIAAVFSTPAMMDDSLGTLAMAFKDYATGLLEAHREAEADVAPRGEGGLWWCQCCNARVPNEHVTFEEFHDQRAGGCGTRVTWSADNWCDGYVEALRTQIASLHAALVAQGLIGGKG